MDIRQNKPIHIRCPKCDYDFGINTNRIVQEQQFQKNRIKQIDKAIAEARLNNINKKSPQWKRLTAQREDCLQQLTALKNVNRNLCENAELEKFRVFYKLVKQVIGDKKAVDLMMEAEDCLLYHGCYDTAIQKYNNFEKA